MKNYGDYENANELPRCKHTRYQIPKKQIPNAKKGKYDASIGELNPKRLN